MWNSHRLGVSAGVGAYIWWGLSPLYFRLVSHIPAQEVVSHRILWAASILFLVLASRRELSSLWQTIREPQLLLRYIASTLLICSNWAMFIWAVFTDQVLEVSFGYFMNPLIIIGLGVVVLGERLSRRQWIGLGFAAAGVLLQMVGLGRLPVLALGVAVTFGLYGLLRKQSTLGPAPGLFLEMGILVFPAAMIVGGSETALDGPDLGLLLAAGPVTLVPLFLFVWGARRVPFSTMGFLQYLAPTLQFVLAVLVFDEELEPIRAASFGLVWLGLAVAVLPAGRSLERKGFLEE